MRFENGTDNSLIYGQDIICGLRVADKGMVAVYNVLRGATLLLGADGDGHSVLVAPMSRWYV